MIKTIHDNALEGIVEVSTAFRRRLATWCWPALVAALVTALSVSAATAHQLRPAFVDLARSGQQLELTIRLNMEVILTGADISQLGNTNDTKFADRAEIYRGLRALPEEALHQKILEFWPQMAPNIHLRAGDEELALKLERVEIIAPDDPALARDTVLHLRADLPPGAQEVQFRWAREYGKVVLRQQGVEAPFSGFLEAGEESVPIALAGGGAQSGWQAFASYVPVGFRHILPLGTDHILFVLGLFFLSTRWRPLLTQVTLFTVAHTLTLALAALGIVQVPAAIVEPLIALSITFVAVENIFTTGLSRTRPFVVFGFGLLHGLGFASVLGEFGLPKDAFIPALLGFNVGVELGQLTIIATAFLTVGYWFGRKPWYREVISIPVSVAIAVIGAWWVIERTLLV